MCLYSRAVAASHLFLLSVLSCNLFLCEFVTVQLTNLFSKAFWKRNAGMESTSFMFTKVFPHIMRAIADTDGDDVMDVAAMDV